MSSEIFNPPENEPGTVRPATEEEIAEVRRALWLAGEEPSRQVKRYLARRENEKALDVLLSRGDYTPVNSDNSNVTRAFQSVAENCCRTIEVFDDDSSPFRNEYSAFRTSGTWISVRVDFTSPIVGHFTAASYYTRPGYPDETGQALLGYEIEGLKWRVYGRKGRSSCRIIPDGYVQVPDIVEFLVGLRPLLRIQRSYKERKNS